MRVTSGTLLAAAALLIAGCTEVPTDSDSSRSSAAFDISTSEATKQICHLTDATDLVSSTPWPGTIIRVNEAALTAHMNHGDCMATMGAPGERCGCPIRIEANIDGRSQLILRENTAQWHHIDFAAPGRLDDPDFCGHSQLYLPTVINDVEWYPAWPDVPTPENRGCDCESDIYDELVPAIPKSDRTPVLDVIQARYRTQIVQTPNAGNDYTTIIEFDDNPYSCASMYIVELSFR